MRTDAFDACAPAGPAIPDWLTAGLSHVDEHARVVAYRAYRIDALAIDQPLLILPLAGSKRVELGAERRRIEPGAYLMIHRATGLHIENLPPAQGGEPYRAWAIGFPWRIVELARSLLATHMPSAADSARTQAFTSGAIEPLLPALRQLLEVSGCAAGWRRKTLPSGSCCSKRGCITA